MDYENFETRKCGPIQEGILRLEKQVHDKKDVSKRQCTRDAQEETKEIKTTTEYNNIVFS